MSLPRILSISFDTISGIRRNALLAEAGYAVAPATSTTRAFELLEQLRFDLVIIGQNVPTAERRLLFLEINRKWNTPILLIDEGEADPMIRARAHIGAEATPKELLAVVNTLAPLRPAKKAAGSKRSAVREPAGC